MINDQAKHAAVARLRKAMELEKIKSTNEVAGYLGLNPIYVSMFFNEKQWPKCSTSAFERLLCWCNSGSTLKGFKAPDPVYKVKEKTKIEWHKEETKFDVPKEVKDFVSQAEIYSVEFTKIKENPDKIQHNEPVVPKYELKEDFNPVKSGEYVDPVELLVEIAKRLPTNVKVVITINNPE